MLFVAASHVLLLQYRWSSRANRLIETLILQINKIWIARQTELLVKCSNCHDILAVVSMAL